MNGIFCLVELCVTLIFTGEYCSDCLAGPNRQNTFSFWGFIDLVTILPLYVMWLWPEISELYVPMPRRYASDSRAAFLNCYAYAIPVFWSAISARHQLILCSIHLLRS